VLLGFLLALGAGRAASAVQGPVFVPKTFVELAVYKVLFAVSDTKPDLSSCICCAYSGDCSRGVKSPEDSKHPLGLAANCYGHETADQESVAGGCSQCPANGCDGCCGHGSSILFFYESVSRIADPGRLPPVPPEDLSAAQRSLSPLLQPPRGV
jgi:hypothetical protein